MGGMAEILLARVKGANPERLVVLKRMHRHLAADQEHVEMFVDEARLATTLRHSNVVEVYEFGEDAGQYYIVMEYLHGHDLRRVLSEMAKRAVSVRLSHALAIIAGVCRGLDYTHERTNANGELLGVVHRDVSPHNVLITYNGSVKLLDFGIAKASSQISRTRTGILKGKVAYMSPEQAMGEELDRRSDVFCIGILLWEMTTGQWLYRRKSELETLKAVVESDAPHPSRIHPNYPRELEQIVMKTLARRREDRWDSAGELADAITEFAARQRFNLAPVMLGRMMASLFSDDVAAWQDARRAGSTLGEHLLAELDREERQANAARKIEPGSGSGSDRRGGSGPAAALADVAFNKRITVDDFDSPTVDHSPDELMLPDKAERGGTIEGMEDEPTTVHTPQRSAPWAGQLAAVSPRATPTSTPRQTGPTPDPAPRPVPGRRGKPTQVVRNLPAVEEPIDDEPEGPPIHMRSAPRWIWMVASAVLAVLAAIWLAMTLRLRHDSEPPRPASPPATATTPPAWPATAPSGPAPTPEIVHPPASAAPPRPAEITPPAEPPAAAATVVRPPTVSRPRPRPVKPPAATGSGEAKPVEPAAGPAGPSGSDTAPAAPDPASATGATGSAGTSAPAKPSP
jgi:serine/threonine protein kinase